VIRVAVATDSGSGVDRDGYRICRSHDATGWAGCDVTMTWDGGVAFAVRGAVRSDCGSINSVTRNRQNRTDIS
jgi:hypothetical protein